MKLIAVLQGPARLMRNETLRTLEDGSLVIGRASSADWVLADPERVISSHHCRIEREQDQFIVTDTSTNGVFVNNEAVGFGLSKTLADGAVLRLGDATMKVSIEAAAPQRERQAPMAPRGPAGASPLLADPFGAARAQASDRAGAAGYPAAARQSATGVSEPIRDDWWADEGPQADAPLPKPPGPAETGGPKLVDKEFDTLLADPFGNEGPSESSLAQISSAVDLIGMMSGVDERRLAQAIDAAGATLEPKEWRRFLERFRAALQDRVAAKW